YNIVNNSSLFFSKSPCKTHLPYRTKHQGFQGEMQESIFCGIIGLYLYYYRSLSSIREFTSSAFWAYVHCLKNPNFLYPQFVVVLSYNLYSRNRVNVSFETTINPVCEVNAER